MDIEYYDKLEQHYKEASPSLKEHIDNKFDDLSYTPEDERPELNLLSEACNLAKIILDELEEIGIEFTIDFETITTDGYYLWMIGALLKMFNADDFDHVYRSLDEEAQKRLLNHLSIAEDPLDDTYTLRMLNIVGSFTPLSADTLFIIGNNDLIDINIKLVKHLNKIIEHMEDEDGDNNGSKEVPSTTSEEVPR